MIVYPQSFKKVSLLKDVDVTYTTTMVDDIFAEDWCIYLTEDEAKERGIV